MSILRRRFPDRSTSIHYVSDVRQFFQVCARTCVSREDVDAFFQHGLAQGWEPAIETLAARLRVVGKGRQERIVYLPADAYAVLACWLALLACFGPPTRLPTVSRSNLLELVQRDKKVFVDAPRRILPTAIGRALVSSHVSEADLTSVLRN